jgi:NDP-sugar pyrophosphorylase family protein
MADCESYPAVILAGGLGTRLRPITEKVPKALVEVAGRPFLEHQIELLKLNSISDIILCVGYLGETIEKRYGDGGMLGVRIRYSHDPAKLLGTGGAIKKALPLLPEIFFVLYGDSYLTANYQEVAAAFRKAGKPVLMTVFANADAWETSNVWFDGRRILLYSKAEKLPQMRYVDYGLSVFNRVIFEEYPENVPFDLANALEKLSRKEQLAGYEVSQRFYEIGSPAGLAELDRVLRNSKR